MQPGFHSIAWDDYLALDAINASRLSDFPITCSVQAANDGAASAD